MHLLSKDDLKSGLLLLDELARAAGKTVEIAVYGGAALVLAYDFREATQDVDAVFEGEKDFVRECVLKIAEEKGWDATWLNDGVKGFVSRHEELQLLREYHSVTPNGGILIHVPTPRYLFAMKCMAMRGSETHDVDDITSLANIAEVRDTEHALSIIENFYPSNMIPAKVQFGVEEIMERVQKERSSDQFSHK